MLHDTKKNSEAGKSWMPLSANLFRLESTNPKKKFPDPGCYVFGDPDFFFLCF